MIWANKAEQLLLPVSPVFLAASLVVALALSMLPLGRVLWMPDWVLVLLTFWGMHQPRRVGMGLAFAMGLCIDVHQAALLGQHALTYCLLIFIVQLSRRRMLWFTSLSQALQLLPLFAVLHALQVLLRVIGGGVWPSIELVLAPLLEAAMWPLASWLLLAPQRLPPQQDDNRPL